MKIKTRKKPLALQSVEALQFRLRENHPQFSMIQHDVAKRMRGYIGEQKVDYHIEQQLPKSFTILPQVCLQFNGSKFEMDTLIISNYGIYIIESKHFAGKVVFDTTFDQFTRSDTRGESGYRNPIIQAEVQRHKLSNWLNERNIQHPPIHYFIAISDPSTIIDVTGDRDVIANVVSHAEQLPQKIMAIDHKAKNGNRLNINGLALGKLILQQCTELHFDVFSTYNIKPDDLLRGVHCPKCNHLPMERLNAKWHCNKCSYTSKNAHLKALTDYFLLIKGSIKNKECRYFLNIKSRHIANRLLRKK